LESRAKAIDLAFIDRVLKGDLPSLEALEFDPGTNSEFELTAPSLLIDLFESQLITRHLDLQARKLRQQNQGFYTIASAGHEGMAAIGHVFRYNDLAFLHYRSTAFFVQRARDAGHKNIIKDILLSFVAAKADPISGGRHKVLGSKSLFVPPQTSTVASHLPKSVGAAYAISLARSLSSTSTSNSVSKSATEKLTFNLCADSVVICSFGDASVNHSTAQGAFNFASWVAYQHYPLPLVFICEDNDIGISTPTPKGWVESVFSNKTGIKYLQANGLDLIDLLAKTKEAEHWARSHKVPVFLHVKLVRLLGHAGSDVETSYHSEEHIKLMEHHDPLLYSAAILIEQGLQNQQQIVDSYQRVKEQVQQMAEEVVASPKLESAEEIKSTLVAKVPIKKTNRANLTKKEREKLFEKDAALMQKPQHMARLLSWALAELMLEYQHVVVFGEDVGKKGGVYGVTSNLHNKFGTKRVLDTLLDEQSILGLAIGLAHNGFIPIPEIQFLAYVHNAEDQIRGEAATLSFFSQGQFTNPMVIRVAGLAYQKGFGGHFHNDNSFAVFRDIPGVVIACPSNGADAVRMLRTCVELSITEQRVVVFIEPIALYMTHDLHQKDDLQWSSIYKFRNQDQSIALGEFSQHGTGKELCIVSYGNGYYLSRQAAKELEQKHSIILTIIDLRWLAPLNKDALLAVIKNCEHLLVVDECRQTGSISEAIFTLVIEGLELPPAMARVTAEDCFIPLAEAANLLLPQKQDIVNAALSLLKQK